MKLKYAALGLLVSSIVAVPVVQALHNNLRPVGISVVAYDGTPPPGEVFANWATRFQRYVLSFGVVSSTVEEVVGLRIDAPSGTPAAHWSMDVNTTNGADPIFQTWAIVPTVSNLPILVDVEPVSSLTSYYTVTPLGNGYNRVLFNASSYLPAGSKLSSIYFSDESRGFGDSWNDQVEGATVNGIAIAPNIQPQPEYDSTLFDL